jgi:hypothetical protein
MAETDDAVMAIDREREYPEDDAVMVMLPESPFALKVTSAVPPLVNAEPADRFPITVLLREKVTAVPSGTSAPVVSRTVAEITAVPYVVIVPVGLELMVIPVLPPPPTVTGWPALLLLSFEGEQPIDISKKMSPRREVNLKSLIKPPNRDFSNLITVQPVWSQVRLVHLTPPEQKKCCQLWLAASQTQVRRCPCYRFW